MPGPAVIGWMPVECSCWWMPPMWCNQIRARRPFAVPWGAEAEGPRPLLGQARAAYHPIVVGGRGVQADGLINVGTPRGKTVWPACRRGTARR